jgi:copper resistance protein B
MNVLSRTPLAIALALAAALPLHAQTHAGHQQADDPHAHHRQQADAQAEMAEPADPHAGHHERTDEPLVSSPVKGEAGRGMVVPADQAEATPSPPNPPLEGEGSKAEHQAEDHSTMDHSGMDHSGVDDSGMNHSAMGHGSTEPQAPSAHHAHPAPPDLPANAPPRTPVPPITPADRVAAFPPVEGHTTHDNRPHYYVVADRLETWDADEGGALAWELGGWLGTDLDRLWVRSEGERVGGEIESADVELFYGRAIARWWDAVVGIRHDFGPSEGPDASQTFAAFGVMGLAPYKFEVAATGYLGDGGQTGLALEAEYETLFTNRLIGQWLAEAELWGKDDPRRGIGSGLSTLEAGFRLRYESHRQFAPYVGVVWERAYGGTADLRRADGHGIEDTHVVVGLRTWF